MKLENIFSDVNSIKIWQAYFKRVNKSTRTLDNESQKETILELQDHLYQGLLTRDNKNQRKGYWPFK